MSKELNSKRLINELIRILVFLLFEQPNLKLLLENFKLMPYCMSLCFRLNIFCHKVIKKIFISFLVIINYLSLISCNGKCSRLNEIVSMPDIRTNFGRQSFGYFLPNLLNFIIKDNFLLNVKDICLFIWKNLNFLRESFIKNFLTIFRNFS